VTSELRERIEDARRVAGAASKRVGADGKVRCGCENLRCRSCRGDGCRSRVEAGANMVQFVGELCGPCYRDMPAEYRLGADERRELRDALEAAGAVGGARARRRGRRRREWAGRGGLTKRAWAEHVFAGDLALRREELAQEDW